MGMRMLATCVAILALGVAAATAFAAGGTANSPEASGHTPEQVKQALALIGPQDPAITSGLIEGCSELIAKGLTSAPCSDLLREAGR